LSKGRTIWGRVSLQFIDHGIIAEFMHKDKSLPPLHVNDLVICLHALIIYYFSN